MKFILSNIADINYAEVEGRYVYQSSFATLPLCQQYRLGMELADLSLAGSLDQNRDACMSAIKKNVAQLDGLPITMHAPFSEVFPHSIDLRIRQVAYDILSEAYHIAESLGAETMVVHANHIATIYHPDWFVDHQAEFWTHFLQQHPGRCAIAIENTIDETPELLLRIAQRVDSPRLGLCLDMGHANLSSTPVETWLRTLASWLLCYHIHNNDGIRHNSFWAQADTHNAIGRGTIDLNSLLRLAQELTPEASATIETTALADSIAWLQENHFIS